MNIPILLRLCLAIIAAGLSGTLALIVLRVDTLTLFYNVPIVAVFVLYVLDVLARWRSFSRGQIMLMVGTIAAALLRARAIVPGYSGHALFLSFALLTAHDRLTRFTALAVLLQVVILKLSWGDWTLATGATLGMIAAFIHRKLAYGQPRPSL